MQQNLMGQDYKVFYTNTKCDIYQDLNTLILFIIIMNIFVHGFSKQQFNQSANNIKNWCNFYLESHLNR